MGVHTYWGQYCRIEAKAGGVMCSNLRLVRAAYTFIDPAHRKSRKMREERHAFYSELLAYKRYAVGVVRRHELL